MTNFPLRTEFEFGLRLVGLNWFVVAFLQKKIPKQIKTNSIIVFLINIFFAFSKDCKLSL